MYLFFITMAAALGGFLFGFDSSVINGTTDALKLWFNATPQLLGLAVSLCLLTAAVGAFFASKIADRIGRVKSMFIASLLFIVSAIGSGLPYSLAQFIFWRAVGGVAVGIASIIVPIYIAEVSPAKYRGRFSSLQQLAIVVGIFISLVSNYLIVKKTGGASEIVFGKVQSWQLMFWMEIIPATLYAIATLLIPESPRYLISKGKLEKASSVMQKLKIQEVQAEVESIKNSFKDKKVEKLSDIFELVDGRKRIAPIVWAGLGLAVLQQFVGINVIFYYGTSLWQAAGFGTEQAFMTSVITSGINLVMTFVAIYLIDRAGRKPLLLVGSIGMAITLSLLTVSFIVGGGANLGAPWNLIALISANLYVAFFAASWGPVMWVMLGEMFNVKLKAAALSICGLAQWFANFLVSFSFPILTDKIGVGGAYSIFAIFAALSILFVAKFIKETKGIKLENM